MKRNLTGAQIREIGFLLTNSWDKLKNEIKLTPKALYNLLKLKKMLAEKSMELEDAMILILEQEGCENRGNGHYYIPDDKKSIVGSKFDELVDQEIEIDYTPIVVTDDDFIPTEIFEALFDFIEMK